MEHATNGQIGQPAACMMENKNEPHADGKPVDYGPRADQRVFGRLRQTLAHAFASPTEHVDNFVQKPAGIAPGPALTRHSLGVMRKTAVKNLMKSMTCCVNAGDWRGGCRGGSNVAELWSSRAAAAWVPYCRHRTWTGAVQAARGPSGASRGIGSVVSSAPAAIGLRPVPLIRTLQ
jgi:hypothetical protein